MRKAGYPAFLFIPKFRIVFRKLDDNYTYNNAAHNIVFGVLNMGSLRRLLLEGMKMPSDLPDSAYVIIDDSGNDRYFEVIIEDPDTPIYTAFGATTLASLQVSKAPSGYCDGAWQIIGANAKDGYGPLAYDIAMEYVGNEGLMCDRTSVSEDAAKVWNFYLNSRPDVKAIQLDSFKKPFLTPKDASDDCTGEYTLARHTDIDIDSGFDPYGNEEHRNKWMDHWSTKKYIKISGTPVIDELNDLNVLYYDWEDIGMRITESKFRQYIRKILLESPLTDREKIAQAQLDYRDYIRDTLVDYQGQSGKAGPNYPKRSTRYDLTPESNDLRRLPKQLWNQMADHQFFEENIRKFHLLGYAGNLDIQKYISSGANKNELSCFAVEKTDKPKKDLLNLMSVQFMDASAPKIFLELEGRTTWCGNFDAFTEQLKDATPEQIEKMASSGLAKRPGRYRSGYVELTDELILDADDFERNKGNIDELILDNWRVKCFWFVTKYGKFESLLNKSVLEKSDPFGYGRQDTPSSIRTQAQNWFWSEIGQSHDELIEVAALFEQRGIPMKFLTYLHAGKGRVYDFQTFLKVAQHIKDSVHPRFFKL